MTVAVHDDGKKDELIGDGVLLLNEVIDKGELDGKQPSLSPPPLSRHCATLIQGQQSKDFSPTPTLIHVPGRHSTATGTIS